MARAVKNINPMAVSSEQLFFATWRIARFIGKYLVSIMGALNRKYIVLVLSAFSSVTINSKEKFAP